MIRKSLLLFLSISIFLFFFNIFSFNKTQAQTCAHTPTSTNSVTSILAFTVAGDYKVWSRILATDSASNSFYLQIDNNCAINIGDQATIPANSFTWVDNQDGVVTNSVIVNLTAGDHTVKITEREGGVGVDKLLFTTDMQCIPMGTGDNCPSVTDTPSPTPTSIQSTPTPIPTIIPTSLPTFTPTPTPTRTPTPTPLPTLTPILTSTPTPTKTPTPTPIKTPTPTLIGNGLQAVYYNNTNFTGSKITRIDPSINFNWGTGSPHSAIANDTFSTRWTGYVVPRYNQTYTFYAKTDDGVRLWVNGQQLINRWINQSATERSGTITLIAGRKYTIRMEYYENNGSALAQLRWSSTSQVKEIIPQSRLYSN